LSGNATQYKRAPLLAKGFGADHHVYLSNETGVLREMKSYPSTLR
jgi:hypothetical protein